jgi:hypothetical protein
MEKGNIVMKKGKKSAEKEVEEQEAKKSERTNTSDGVVRQLS